MATSLGEVLVTFGATVSPFNSGIVSMVKSLGDFQEKAAFVGGLAGLAIGAAAVAIGAASIKMAGDFQQGVNRLRTGGGDIQDSFNTLSSGIIRVSEMSGLLSGPLTQAMYQIVSSGQRGAQAFDTLAAAAKGAQIEQANVADVANTLTSAMTNFGTRIFSASDYMNGLIAAVAHGRVTLQDLSTAMGPIEPVAHQLGISFSDLAAAMAVQTNAGIPAARAATGLRYLMQSLEAPTKKAETAMTAMGLSSVAVGDEMKKSLPGALQMIYDAALRAGPAGSVPFNRALSDMVGGARGLMSFLALTGGHMKDFTADAALVAGAMRKGKGEVDGWAIAQSNLNIQMGKAGAAIAAAGIAIGTKLIPMVSSLLAWLTPIIGRFATWIGQGDNLRNVMIGLGVAVGLLTIGLGILAAIKVVSFFSSLVTGAIAFGSAIASFISLLPTMIGLFGLWAASLDLAAIGAGILDIALSPITLIILGVAAVIAGIILLILNWGKVMTALGNTFRAIGGFFKTVWADIVAIFTTSLQTITTFFTSAWRAIVNFIQGVWNGIAATARTVWGAITGFFKTVWNTIIGIFTTAGSAIVTAFTWLYSHNYIIKALVDAIAGFFRWIASTSIAIWNGFTAFLVAAWNTIKSVASTIFGAVAAFFTAVWNGIAAVTRTIWTAITGFLSGLWGGISSIASSIFTAIKNIIGTIWSTVSGITIGIWNNITGFLSGVWNNITSAVSGLWKTITSIFANAWSGISGALGNLAGSIGGFFANLASQFWQWGSNLIGNLISGIGSMLGNLWSSIGNIASGIAGFLGFHSPTKMGAGKDADTWMPNMMSMFTSGIRAKTPEFQAALNAVVAMPPGMKQAISAPTAILAPNFSPAKATQPQTININLQVDGKTIATAVVNNLTPATTNQLGKTVVQSMRSRAGVRY